METVYFCVMVLLFYLDGNICITMYFRVIQFMISLIKDFKTLKIKSKYLVQYSGFETTCDDVYACDHCLLIANGCKLLFNRISLFKNAFEWQPNFSVKFVICQISHSKTGMHCIL